MHSRTFSHLTRRENRVSEEKTHLWKNYVAMVEFETADHVDDFFAEIQKNRFVDAEIKTPKMVRVESSEVAVNEFSFWELIDDALWEVQPNSVTIRFSSEFHYEF